MTGCRGRMAALLLVAVLGAGAAAPAAAALSDVGPTGFIVTVRHELKATPQRTWEALGEVDRWWNPQHSWSGSAANLSLGRRAGDCFCERWAAGSVEHGRVVMALDGKLLRLDAALGPLQALAVHGVLSFAISVVDGRTVLVVTYRVSGSDKAGLQELSGPVDGVISEQARRLAAWVDTGKPD
jgi:hypothetical protein